MQDILVYIVIGMALFFAASRVVKALRRVNRASNDDPTCDDCEGCQLHDICKDREKKM